LARQELLAILKIDPVNVNAHANLGMVEFSQGAYQEASREFEAALSKSPSLSSARAFLGMCEVRLGAADHGRKLLEESLAGVKDRTLHVQAGLELVRSYSELGMIEKAEPVLRQLEDFDPANSEVLYTLYRLHSEIASSALRKLTAVDADSAWVHEVLGQNHLAQEQYSPAEQEFRKAIERGPHLTGLHYQLGEALLLAARTEENRTLAEKEFYAELQMTPHDAGSLFKLAEIALERSNAVAAKSFVVRAIAARPGFAEAHALLGKILEQEGNLKGATGELETAEKLAPEVKSTRYRLAQLYRAQGRTADSDREAAAFRSLSAAEPVSETRPATSNKPSGNQ